MSYFTVARETVGVASEVYVANEEHLSILKRGVKVWNKWRENNKDIRPDLNKADLSEAIFLDSDAETPFIAIDFHNTDLRQAKLFRATLYCADLSGADLSGAYLSEAMLLLANCYKANLTYANLIGADLRSAILVEADLNRANLSETNLAKAQMHRAILTEANLTKAALVETILEDANLSSCRVYGVAAWNVNLTGANQSSLIITPEHEPVITVDNLEIAQFIYLLLHNEKIRNVINTIANKAVLILGRFSDETRKEILEAIRDKVRAGGYVPIVFDFEKAQDRDFTETIKILAGLSLFVIADITNPKSTPLELQATVPDYMIPFIPICQEGETAFAMFVDLQKQYRWVMDIRRYKDKEHLIEHFENGIIRPALEMHRRLLIEKNEELKSKPIDEF